MERREYNRLIRESLKMSGRELAERVEVSKQAISLYELGKTRHRLMERVIELELDLAIERCEDVSIKEICEGLKLRRNGA